MGRNNLYILNEQGEPTPEPDDTKWALWMFDDDAILRRLVNRTDVNGDMTVAVSTVFLGINHQWQKECPPILWETMIFGGPLDRTTWRCSGSREQAEAQHVRVVTKAKAATS